MSQKIIKILGTPYKIRFVEYGKEPCLTENNYAGLCEYFNHRILVLKSNTIPGNEDEGDEYNHAQESAVLRHELIHAFLNESGLKQESNWARNEEMVDWFAVQFPKLLQAFKKAGAI